MTGLTILLLSLAGLVLVAALAATYIREYRIWKRGHAAFEAGSLSTIRGSDTPTFSVRPAPAEPAAVGVAELDATGGTARRNPSEVFRYTIRRPQAAVRKKMPDLGGFSEVPLRLYDQLGNRFTVHQKVRLN
ncbi:MAG TPA: hypothetical protein VF190_06955 [Rhodothermales bacterium]